MKSLVKKINWSLNRTEKLNDKHHLFGGMSAKKGTSTRDIAEMYELFVFIEHEDHIYEVEKHKKKYTSLFCTQLGLDYVNINRIMKKPHKYWDDVYTEYMNNVKEHLKRLRGEDN